MANSTGPIVRFLIKWLVIPVGLAAIGFFVVGPRLGAQGREEAKETNANGEQAAPPPAPTPAIKGDPDVKISARPVTRRRPRRAAEPRREPEPANEAIPASTNPAPPDEPPPLP